jgi:membrane protease YdiL (CAAX protease family)
MVPSHQVLHWMGGALIQWACSMAVSLPLVTVAVRSVRLRGRDVSLGSLVQLAIFFLISLTLTRLEPVWTFIKSPWQAMILEAAWALAFILATRSSFDAILDENGDENGRAGLTFRISPQAWRDSLVITGLMLLFVAARKLAIDLTGLGRSEGIAVVFEYFLYELTMPGIAEELGYRGVIQPELNAALGRPWKLLGAQVGWGWVITSVLFWAPHAFRVDPQMQLSFYWPTLTLQLIAGFVYGWVRERAGSVFPPMLTHNLVNVCRILV